jgi:hypothetical protein
VDSEVQRLSQGATADVALFVRAKHTDLCSEGRMEVSTWSTVTMSSLGAVKEHDGVGVWKEPAAYFKTLSRYG